MPPLKTTHRRTIDPVALARKNNKRQRRRKKYKPFDRTALIILHTLQMF